MDPEAFRALQPITRQCAYLNHASLGPLPLPAAAAMAAAAREQSELGSEIFPAYDAAKESAREEIARLIGATPDEVALTRNTVEGLSIVASGIDWKPGESVVVDTQEFPGNIYPWLNLEARFGVKVRLVPAENGRVAPERLMAAAEERTRVIAVSFVQFSSGYRIALEELGAFCRGRGIFLVVDGIQGVGALPIDVMKSRVDFLACGAQKWLLAPPGIGFLYVRRPLWEEIALTDLGHGSVLPHPERYLDYRFTLRPDARRFEGGVMSYAELRGLRESLRLLLAAGIGAIETRVLALTDRVVERLTERGYRLLSARGAGERSGTVSFAHPSESSKALLERLRAGGVIASVREGALRFSPHYYNTEEEIDRALALLP
jgi:selenocysteine lyase/cysteine desulfurase